MAVIDLGCDKETRLRTFESVNPSHDKRKERIFAISDTKAYDSRNLHIVKSASNNEANSQKLKHNHFDPNLLHPSNHRDFMPDESNDQSYTIMQVASVSNQKAKADLHLPTQHGPDSNLNSNHKLCYVHSGMSALSQTPQGTCNHLITQTEMCHCSTDLFEHKMSMVDDQIRQVNILQLKPTVTEVVEEGGADGGREVDEREAEKELVFVGKPPRNPMPMHEMNIV